MAFTFEEQRTDQGKREAQTEMCQVIVLTDLIITPCSTDTSTNSLQLTGLCTWLFVVSTPVSGTFLACLTSLFGSRSRPSLRRLSRHTFAPEQEDWWGRHCDGGQCPMQRSALTLITNRFVANIGSIHSGWS